MMSCTTYEGSTSNARGFAFKDNNISIATNIYNKDFRHYLPFALSFGKESYKGMIMRS